MSGEISKSLTGNVDASMIAAGVEASVLHYWRSVMVSRQADKETTRHMVVSLLQKISRDVLDIELIVKEDDSTEEMGERM